MNGNDEEEGPPEHGFREAFKKNHQVSVKSQHSFQHEVVNENKNHSWIECWVMVDGVVEIISVNRAIEQKL